MNKVILRAIDSGIIHLAYDKNINLYTIYVFDKNNSILQTYREISMDKAEAYLNKHTTETVEPYLPVVIKSIKLGIDPSTVIS